MKKYNLLGVAHPDDETIFFGGLLQVYRRRPWKVVCVTDGAPRRLPDAAALAERRHEELCAALDAAGLGRDVLRRGRGSNLPISRMRR